MADLKNIIDENQIEMSDYDVFVETGLFLGYTLECLYKNNLFDNIKNDYSIEIVKEYIDNAINKFDFIKEDKFELVLGESSCELKK